MSIKSTQTISREMAISILIAEVHELPNDTLADLLDLIADSERSKRLSRFDNFIVHMFADDDKGGN